VLRPIRQSILLAILVLLLRLINGVRLVGQVICTVPSVCQSMLFRIALLNYMVNLSALVRSKSALEVWLMMFSGRRIVLVL
jgi:hypothetical protein